MASPPRNFSLAWPLPQLSGAKALRAAEQELLASQEAARRALEVMTAYEARHGEEPLGR